jgi:tetrahydromethanopterin S-methyltransferase subunit G
MDIAPLSMLESQTKLQERADRVEMNTDTVKENDKQFIKKIGNDAIEPNVGQNLDVIADNQIDKKEELYKQLQQEIKWAQDKQKLLNLKEVKLLQMREIAEQGKQVVVTPQQLRNLNHRLDKLAAQVSAIDSDSRRTKGGKKLE